MRRGEDPRTLAALGIVGAVAVVWFSLIVAPFVSGGLPLVASKLPAALQKPFEISLCRDSLSTVLFLLMLYGLCIAFFAYNRHNYRRREEHGSAKWGDVRALNKRYAQKKSFEENKLFTQNFRMSLDEKAHHRNKLSVIVGGAGSGKTRFYAKPNLYQANTSFIVTDPNG